MSTEPSKAPLTVNLLLGFTGIGWLVALIWSFGSTKQVVVIATPISAPNATPTAQTASTAIPLANKSIAERIADLKAMLDSGAISETEFNLLKQDAMKGMG